MSYQKKTRGRSRSDEDLARQVDREAAAELIVAGFSQADATDELKRREAARRDK